MKNKINTRFYLVSAVSIIITMAILLFVFYTTYKKQVISDLEIFSNVIISQDNYEEWENEEIRVTYIDFDGNVVYDSAAQIEKMDNHADRPEVIEATKDGIGTAIRHSDTINKTTYYYAVLLENGNILRVSRDAQSIMAFFTYFLEVILLLVIVLLIIAFIIIYFSNKNLAKPIENMAKDNYKMRQEFSANVSHELKTPLTSISGYAQLIEQDMAKEEDIPIFAEKIRKESDRLLNLINDIIKISELDEKSIIIEADRINLFEMAKECVEILNDSALNRNIKLNITGENAFITGKTSMIYEVVYNLLDNAIRYNIDNGKVDINVKKENSRVIMTVEDTGIGIKKKYQDRIFERFFRVDKSHSKATGGTGLGLSIVKHAVAAHDGRIELDSKEGFGTKIKIIFEQKKDA